MLFLVTRSLVGVGEAAFSCVATTIIGDMFQGTIRTQMISIFYFALPIGSKKLLFSLKDFISN